MEQETALPAATEQVAEASGQPTADQLDQSTEQVQETKDEGGEKKPEKTPEQREVERLRRKLDRVVRQREELRAQQGLQSRTIENDNHENPGDSDELKLSRAELDALVKREAEKLAPTIKQQQAEIEHRRTVVQSLAKEWGQERFDSLASDLDDAFGGLAEGGKPKPATDAIFESDDPKALIEYLADPDNAEEAERIARLGAVQAGRAIAKLELKLAQKKAEAKPQASKAPSPVEPVRGAGNVNRAPDPKDLKAWIKWANEQEARR